MFLLVAFCIGGFQLGYLVGVVIVEVPGNGFVLFCFVLIYLLCLMSTSKEVLLSIFFNNFVFLLLLYFPYLMLINFIA